MALSGLWENIILTEDGNSMCLTDTGAKWGEIGTPRGSGGSYLST